MRLSLRALVGWPLPFVAWLLLLLLLGGAAPAQDFTFVHISDPHVGAAAGLPHLRLVLAEIEGLVPKPRLVVVTGDLTEKGEKSERERFDATVVEFEKRAGIRVLRAPGNHDARWNAAPEGKACDAAGPYPRFVRIEDVGFVALDSSLAFEQHGHLGTVQLERAAALMRQDQDARDFVLAMHHPPGDGSFLDDEQELAELCAAHPIALVLTGHGHAHKSWQQNGVPHVMAIGVMNPSFGYRVFHVTKQEIAGEAITIGPQKRATKSDVVAKRAPFARTLPASRPASRGTETRVRLAATFAQTPLALADRCVLAAEEGLVVALAPDDLSVLWKAQVAAPVWCSPFAVGDGLAVADAAPALRLFTKDGEPRGTLALPAPVTAVGAPGADGARLLALGDGALVAVDLPRVFGAGGGDALGAAPAVRPLARLPAFTRVPPLEVGDQILVAAWDRHVHVLELGGKEVASLLVHDSFYNAAATAAPLLLGTSAVFFGHDQRLLVCSEKGFVTTAKLAGVQPAYSGGVLLDATRALLGSMDGALALVDLEKMAVERRVALPGAVFDSTPCVAGARAWVGTMHGTLCGVDLATFAVVRRHELGGYVLADPVLCGQRVLACSTTGVVVSVPR